MFSGGTAICYRCLELGGKEAKEKADASISDKARSGEKYSKGDWQKAFESHLKTDDQIRIDSLERKIKSMIERIDNLENEKMDKFFLKKKKKNGCPFRDVSN